jgi:hypothetical protein
LIDLKLLHNNEITKQDSYGRANAREGVSSGLTEYDEYDYGGADDHHGGLDLSPESNKSPD